MKEQASAADAGSARRRGAGVEYLLLMLLAALIYTTRIASPPVRGEESRRATVTMHFLESGNYLVPQQQGNALFMSARPPLQNWLMLPFYFVTRSMDAVTIRLPSILAVFATSSLLYFYGLFWMSRACAFIAAAAFPTMLQVMELGRTAETDLVLTVFVTAGLFGWHYYYEIRKMPARAWTLGYAMIALATLTKGAQGPVYFFATTFLYLCWTRRVGAFFDLRHGLGLCVYALMVAAWLAPYYFMTGRAGAVHVFTGDIGIDDNETAARVLRYLVSFPFLLFGCMLPWSVLLLLYFRRSVRGIAAKSRPLAFAAMAFCVAFLTVWLMPGSKTRFLLNMYPCVAICVGVALDCAYAVVEKEENGEAEPGRAGVRGDLRLFTTLMACLAFLAAALMIGISVYASLAKVEIRLAMSPPRAVFFGVVSIVLGFVIVRNRHKAHPKAHAASLFCVAAFFGLLYNLPIVDAMDRWSERTDIAFQELYEKHLLPDHRPLVSLDETPHLINYLHFLQLHVTIPKVTLAEIQEMRKTNDVYFVSDTEKFPLQYTLIAKLPLRRYRYNSLDKTVVFGKISSE
jgi:4-amino-4-deoxy-L-arabinose transferase-like glycosyltransferase